MEIKEEHAFDIPGGKGRCVLKWQNWVLTCRLEQYRKCNASVLNNTARSSIFNIVSDKSRSNRRVGCTIAKRARKTPKATQKYRKRARLSESSQDNFTADNSDHDVVSNIYDIENNANFSINLFEACLRLRDMGVQYNHTKFPAIIIKFRRPSSAVLVFSTGSVLCTGTKDEKTAIFIVNYVVRLLRIRMYPSLRIQPGSWNIENVVADTRTQQRIDVYSFARSRPESCVYEPKIFPAATYRKTIVGDPDSPNGGDVKKITILIFNSGKIVLTGAKYGKDIFTAFKECLSELVPYMEDIEFKKPEPKTIVTTTDYVAASSTT